MRVHPVTKKFVLFLIFIILFIIVGNYLDIDPERSRDFFSQYPIVVSSIIFIVFYVVGTFLVWVGPKDILRVASLFVFGVIWSTVVIYIGEMLNMVTMFWFSRRLGRPFVENRLKGRLKNIDGSLSSTSVPVIFFMKFYPIIPFRFLDLTYGLTKISFSKYAIVSLVAAPIRLYVIQYFLDLMIQFGLTAVKGDGGLFVERYMELVQYLVDRPAIFWSLTAYSFSAIVFFIILLARRKGQKVLDPASG